MKVWVVYFRGEAEYATMFYQDAQDRALFLLAHFDGEVQIRQEVRP